MEVTTRGVKTPEFPPIEVVIRIDTPEELAAVKALSMLYASDMGGGHAVTHYVTPHAGLITRFLDALYEATRDC